MLVKFIIIIILFSLFTYSLKAQLVEKTKLDTFPLTPASYQVLTSQGVFWREPTLTTWELYIMVSGQRKLVARRAPRAANWDLVDTVGAIKGLLRLMETQVFDPLAAPQGTIVYEPPAGAIFAEPRQPSQRPAPKVKPKRSIK